MSSVTHLTMKQLESGLDEIAAAPRDRGVIRLIVRRPAHGARELLERCELDAVAGLVGDSWLTRGSSRTEDGSAHPGKQLTIMNARSIALIAQDASRWALAGDQIYADLDLSEANLPPGARLRVGTAIVAVSDAPHVGCRKFVERFGADALRFVRTPTGRSLRLRGVSTSIVTSGRVAVGDPITRI